jgi:hypothetical protein
MIHPHSDSGADHGSVSLPNLIRTIAGMHDYEFLLVAQGGIRCMSQQRKTQDCGHNSNSGHSPVRTRADLYLSKFSQLRLSHQGFVLQALLDSGAQVSEFD